MEPATIAENVAKQVSLSSLISEADFVVQSVMLLLLFASVWSWAAIFNKFASMNSVLRNFSIIEKLFSQSSSLEDFHKEVKNYPKHPAHKIFMSALGEFSKNQYSDLKSLSDGEKTSFRERLSNAMEVAKTKSLSNLEEGLSFLATTGSATPFIGLFGTVWGIMNSFQSIASAKNTSLAVVAPGIAEALLATAAGLFVAIPALIFYNYLVSKLNSITEKSEEFSMELDILFSRKLDEK